MADRHHEKAKGRPDVRAEHDRMTGDKKATVSDPGPGGLRDYKPPLRPGTAQGEVDGPWEWDDHYGWLFLHHPTQPAKHPRDGGPEPPWRAEDFADRQAAMPLSGETRGTHQTVARSLGAGVPESPPDRPRAVPGVPPGAEGASHERAPVPRPQSGPVVSAGGFPGAGGRPGMPAGPAGLPWAFPGGPAIPPPRPLPSHPFQQHPSGNPLGLPPGFEPPPGPELRTPLPPYQPRTRE